MAVMVQQQKLRLTQVESLAAKVQSAGDEGEGFLTQYFLPRRQSSSILLSELDEIRRKIGIRTEGSSFQFEPVEGTGRFLMLTITANYEGTYEDLIEFMSEVDRSDRFIIIESMQATPVSEQNTINLQVQMNTFVRNDGAAVEVPE
jgi:Tfp pilus assembly protein PilO